MMVPLRPETLVARLRDLGIATPQQIEQAKQELANTQERFSAILMRQGLLRDADAGKRLAAQCGSVPQPLDARPAPTPSAAQIPTPVWRRHRLMPMREEGGKLLLVTDDPLSVFALDFFQSRCGCVMEAALIREEDFADLLGATDQPSARKADAISHTDQTPSVAAEVEPGSSDEPIIRLVDSMLAEAVRRRASDIHIEPGTARLRVRYRIDGVLHEVTSPPPALHGPLVSRVKIMAGLNIAEKRLPQDGRLQLAVEHRSMDVRISTLPASHGESIVMRLLDRSQPTRGLPELGLLPEEQARWAELIRRPHGMVLATGPTGSGKTTTLYGALALLNQPNRKLITVEDPVEYQLPGVNQVAVKPSIGLTFAAGLRSMLRQAPDVIRVGEIRDQETAQIAVQAALTGHLVLSTLHTNDAPSAITRLIDMGLPPFLIASTVQGVLAQRLVRRICPDCRITDNATLEERQFLEASEMAQVIRSNGCDRCHGSGFFGRVGIFELLTVTGAIRALIVRKPTASALRQAALRAGMRSLREDGRLKVREGLTTVAEVMRVVLDA
ncbi:MAG: Flp pilus assembly complex ATPase component TadA [Candidatus Omnitrophica bacterium]|nr:Flp pilus assembly complex ATPase component TadA [Candidatus Omnitrophota bacterium]